MSEIVAHDNPILARKASSVPVEKIHTPEIKRVIARMKKALASEPLGVAIAAPQIGESLRIFVVGGKIFSKQKKGDVSPEPDRTYINPEILKTSRKKREMHEGCLSIKSKNPDALLWGTVLRAEKIKIRAYDEVGKQREHNVSGFISQIFQHEIDHLEGILYTTKAISVYEEKTSKATRIYEDPPEKSK